MARSRRRSIFPLVVVLVLAAAAVFVVRGAARRSSEAVPVGTEEVQRRTIEVTIEASGSIEPIDLVEVKSKASGQILAMPVEIGTHVRAGDLLAQVDTVNVQNQYNQAQAALKAAQAKVDISQAQKKRSDDLFAQQIITADEHESAILDYANAQSALAKARSDLDIARQNREDATVRAPVDGTVLSQLVTVGQVIASATSSVSGGTSLLTMADLGRIRMRTLVSERDIGSVRVGQEATVTVDAYPQRSFQGAVTKIEPQAVVQQSVTLFPVLVSVSNEQGLLLPGMNGDVEMLVDRRENALSISVDAVRSVREIRTLAEAVGVDPDSAKAQLDRQVQQLRAARTARMGERPDSTAAANGGATSSQERWQGRGRFAGARPGGGNFGGTGGNFAGGANAASGGMRRPGGGSPGGGAGGFPGGAGAGGWSGGMGSQAASRAQFAFVKTANGFEPRLVRTGLTNFDYVEVMGGLNEGDEVAQLGVAEMIAKRTQTQDMIRARMGNGVPGSSSGGSRSSGRRG